MLAWVIARPMAGQPIHIRWCWLMHDGTKVLGLDVHKETIAVAFLGAAHDLPVAWCQVSNHPAV